MKVCIVGLGNVGLSLYQHFKALDLDVIGVEINPQRVAELKRAGCQVYTKLEHAAENDVWIITIDTGSDCERLFALIRRLPLKRGALVSVESTVPPGTCSQLACLLAEKYGPAGQYFHLIHAPHRILFGTDTSPFSMPRVIGGYTPACLALGRAFYESLGADLVPVSDIRIAELSKIVENTIRFVEIALAQDVAQVCNHLGIDFDQLRDAVNSKGNVALKEARLGVGGECLPKDTDFFFRIHPTPLIAGAIASNAVYIEHIFQQCRYADRILIDGITYKPGVKDARHSPGADLARRLQALGKAVYVSDPLFAAEEIRAMGFTPAPESMPPGVKYDLTIRNGRLEM